MTEQLKFEAGKHYRTRDGRKATVYLIRPTYMAGEVEGAVEPVIWHVGGGWRPEPIPHGWDLVSEWREPARVMVGLIRRRSNGELDLIEIDSETYDEGLDWKRNNGWELIARHELVEGEGME